jgi:hypothetical protein
MRTKRWWLVVTAFALLPACGDDTSGNVRKDAAPDGAGAKDVAPADRAPDVQVPPDNPPDLPADAPAADLGSDLVAAETGRADGSPSEAGAEARAEAGAVDVARPEVRGEAGKLDSASPDVVLDVAGEAGPAPSYACRDDSDCCIVTESCSAMAYLYSKGPGASGMPSIPPPPSMCPPCMQPAVQVRCDQGQCVGTKVSGVSSGPLVKDHCGLVAEPDGGAVLFYQPAYAGAQQTSWGCG